MCSFPFFCYYRTAASYIKRPDDSREITGVFNAG